MDTQIVSGGLSVPTWQEMEKFPSYVLDNSLLEILLIDRSRPCSGSKKPQHIIWATDNYQSLDSEYSENAQISIAAITGDHGNIIQPRVRKTKEDHQARARDKGEVFTPSWICNAQNNRVDAQVSRNFMKCSQRQPANSWSVSPRYLAQWTASRRSSPKVTRFWTNNLPRISREQPAGGPSPSVKAVSQSELNWFTSMILLWVVKVLDDRHIQYQGEMTSLSGLVQRTKGFSHPVQGTLWFTYNGEVLANLRDRLGK